MDLSHLRFVGRILRIYQQLGLQALVRGSGVLKLLPKRLQELEGITPDIQPKFSAELIAPVTPAVGPKKYRVAMLIGCAQDLIFSNINRDTVEVLARNGCEVFTPPKQLCCGSLHAHNGEWEWPSSSRASSLSSSRRTSSTPSSLTPAAAAPT